METERSLGGSQLFRLWAQDACAGLAVGGAGAGLVGGAGHAARPGGGRPGSEPGSAGARERRGTAGAREWRGCWLAGLLAQLKWFLLLHLCPGCFW